MATLIDAAYENSEHISCNQNNRNGFRRKGQLDLVTKNLVNKYMQYKYQPDRINSIIQLDHKCTMQKAQSSLTADLRCFSLKAQPMSEEAQQSLLQTQLSYVLTRSSTPKLSMPICEIFTETLKCFDLEGCLSIQESQFLKNLLVTFYKVTMDEIVNLQDIFGSRGKFLKFLEDNIEDHSKGQQEIKLALDIIYSATENYKVLTL